MFSWSSSITRTLFVTIKRAKFFFFFFFNHHWSLSKHSFSKHSFLKLCINDCKWHSFLMSIVRLDHLVTFDQMIRRVFDAFCVIAISCSILQSTQLSWFRFLTLSLFLWFLLLLSLLWFLSLSSLSLISLSLTLFSIFSRRLFSTLSSLMLRLLSDVTRIRIIFDVSRSKSRANDEKISSIDDVHNRRTFVSW
jgi:hypothetical protein